ncbi:MAG TPA: bifunctional enoyl-CoA hydratase/phosphate acetyltransferase [Candidatus Sulfotelmatobacter sp.]|jgi:phosphate acetyltransferase|nr:bifunctional enoyl-CoA hydratase/phosphate acetyltransferase [Candidatus Sulfotelmatobacter sp.]
MVIIENKTFDEISIGQSAKLERTLTKDDITLFGVMSGDANPNHFQSAEDGARQHRVVGHGMWGASLISALLGNELPGAGTVYKSQSLDFKTTVALDDTLTVTITVKSKKDADKTVFFDCLAINQKGETVFTGEASVFAPLTKQSNERLDMPEVKVSRGHHVFEKLIERCSELKPVSVSVCYPCDEVSLRGPVEAAEAGLIDPILVGPKAKIEGVAKQYGIDIAKYRILDVSDSLDAAERAVALCRTGEAEVLMKGSLHTDEMMHEVARKDTGLRTGRRISHVFIMDVPTYPRTLLITDAAVNIYPTLEDKVDILQNAIDLALVLEIKEPKCAILSAVETVYPKITSTIEAAALCKMADRGQIKGGVLDGPLAFDNAISEEAAKIKKINSPVAGKADILLVPDLEAGNMLAKQLAYLADADAAGIVLGARVPIVLTSRADSAKARLASCAVAVLFARSRQSTLGVAAQ